MAFDIEKMKADGVSSHLIELASMNQETFLLLIARRLEHDKIFQQFMGQNVGSVEAMYPYAVAAGLMSEYDREWLIDEDNPYKSQSGEVWYTGTLEQCDPEQGGSIESLLQTSVADTEVLNNEGENYRVWLNDEEMTYSADEITWYLGDSFDESIHFFVSHPIESEEYTAVLSFPPSVCNAGTTYEISVAHK